MSLLNPYLLIALAAAFAGTGWVSYSTGHDNGRNTVLAAQKAADDVRAETLQIAQQGAAQAIATIEVKNVTITRKIEREIQENTVYRDCRHSAEQLRDINEAITGQRGPEPAGAGPVPAASSPAK